MNDPLPAFRYDPDPLATGSVETGTSTGSITGGDAAAFLGPVGWLELQLHPDALQTLRNERDQYGAHVHEWEEYISALDKEGSSTASLFRCLHCGAPLAYSDFE